MRLPLERTPRYPEETHALLPTTLRLACGHFDAGTDRDVFLTGALAVLSACMPGARVWTSDGAYHLHLMVQVVAPASSGKGVLRYARQLGARLDASIRLAHEQEMEAEEVGAGKRGVKRTTPTRRLFLSGNASEAVFFDILAACGTAGPCLFEEEADTVSKILSKDWGDYTDIFRKAFHHEGHESLRSDRSPYLEQVIMAACISGTPAQFSRFMGSEGPENGLFSRFGYYVFSGERAWRSQRPGAGLTRRMHYMAETAARVEDLYYLLAARTKALHVKLDEDYWDAHDRLFGSTYAALEEHMIPDAAAATVARAGVMASRCAGVLAVLRAFDEGEALDTVPSIVPSADDGQAALLIVNTWMQHGIALLTNLPQREGPPVLKIAGRNERRERFAAELPGEFAAATARALGAQQGLSARSVVSYLAQMVEAGELKRDARGFYQKVESSAP